MGFANDLLTNMKRAGDVVEEKVTGVVEKSKVSYAIISAEAELDDLYKSLGKAVYYASKEVTDADTVDAILERVEKKIMVINDLRMRSADIRGVKICNCGYENAQDSLYCGKCGVKLTED